jgi:hypothetical protein
MADLSCLLYQHELKCLCKQESMMKIANNEMNVVTVIVRSTNGDILGLVTLQLLPTLFLDEYRVDEFIVDKTDGNFTITEDYPLELLESIKSVMIDFSCRVDRAEAIAKIVSLFFDDLGVIIFNFENDEIRKALGGEFIF